eukprot:4434019-Pleurochrysis_carterae.AAC.1
MSTDSEVEVVVDMNQPEDSDVASSVHGSSFNGPRQRRGGRRIAAAPVEGARQPARRAARQPVGTIGRRPASNDNSSDTTEQPQVHDFENMAAEQRAGSEQPVQQQMQPPAAPVGPTAAKLQLQANQQQLQQHFEALQRLLQQSLQQQLPPAFNEPPAQPAVEQPLSAAPQQQ